MTRSRQRLLRYHHDTARYGAYGGSFVPAPDMPSAEALDALMELMHPDGIGYSRAGAIVEAVANGKVARALATILAERPLLEWRGPASRWSAVGPLRGEVVAFTGTFERLTRAEAGVAAEQAGAIVGGGVTFGTTLLVAGEKAGSTLSKARKLGICISSETEFLTRLAG